MVCARRRKVAEVCDTVHRPARHATRPGRVTAADGPPWSTHTAVRSPGHRTQQCTRPAELPQGPPQSKIAFRLFAKQPALRLVGSRLGDDGHLAPVAHLLGWQLQGEELLEQVRSRDELQARDLALVIVLVDTR